VRESWEDRYEREHEAAQRAANEADEADARAAWVVLECEAVRERVRESMLRSRR
jgi:hypothetical protein